MEQRKKRAGKRKPMTLLLDKTTFELLERYSEEKFGSVNYSQAVRAIVREYYAKDKEH